VENTPVTVLILDNLTTGMTGGQESHATGRLAQICEGLGVEKEHIRIIKPLHNQHEINVQIMKEELAYNGLSVIIPIRECIQTIGKKKWK
jgi:indolepyruvate ferredoxin oxidoreductase alpha subunit